MHRLHLSQRRRCEIVVMPVTLLVLSAVSFSPTVAFAYEPDDDDADVVVDMVVDRDPIKQPLVDSPTVAFAHEPDNDDTYVVVVVDPVNQNPVDQVIQITDPSDQNHQIVNQIVQDKDQDINVEVRYP